MVDFSEIHELLYKLNNDGKRLIVNYDWLNSNYSVKIALK